MLISLNKIIISNFKSFSGETVIGPIQPFTAIIGPNGVGKSNIMDAISFALGEEPTALRVKRLGELVYRGSIRKSTIECTYVKVIFKINTINSINEKSFTRIIHCGISQYKIDDKIVTNICYMTELQEIGLNIKAGNFLIPQGYIEYFAMKTPKNLTAMFERIINSNKYKADYDRLKLEFLKMAEEIHFEQKMKKQILIQKKCAIMEKAETEKHLKLKEQRNKKKLKFQLISLLLIKKRVEFLQDEKIKIKSKIDEYLRDKKAVIGLLEHTESQFKSLSSSLEDIEQDILKMENIIEQKKIEHIPFEEGVLHWQKKRDCARISLDSANKARDTKKKIIRELNDELEQIDNKLTELRKASRTSTIELSNSQVKRYMELTNEVEYRVENFVKQIKSLMHDQQEDHDKLDNENRRKQELEDKEKQIRLKKVNLEMRLKRLQDLSTKSKATLIEKTAKKEELNKKITETKTKLLSLENNIVKIKEELSEADFENNTILRKIKKNETINILKQIYSGVYGRLSDLCKPIHPRYNVAVTKVFGKNINAIIVDTKDTATQCIQFLKRKKIDIEIFLPLDSIKKIILKERLRAIKEPQNVKLLYDVLNISSSHINNAVLFVTKNTLVCEISEHAKMLAYSNEQEACDCVSLDGCFYCKNGLISGGQIDLIVKAKQWNEGQVFTLKEQKAQLMQELRNLPKISLMQSEFDIMNVEIYELTHQDKYMETDIKKTENEIVEIQKELDMIDGEIILLNMAIVEIDDNMQKRNKEIKNMKKYINSIKNEIFADFCNDINVPDISYYEKNNLRIYKEQKMLQMELEQQYNCIKNQLRFENENDIESKVFRWQQAVKHADTEWNKVYQQEYHAKIKVEREEIKMSNLKNNYTNMAKDLKDVKKKLAEHKSQISVIEKLYLESRKAHIAVQRKIELTKIECNAILKECKMENIIIPMSETHHRLEGSIFTNNSSSNTELSENCEMLTKIDFSQFPEDVCNSTEEELQDMARQLNEKIIKIENEFKNVVNLKIDKKIDIIKQQIQEINTNLRNYHNKYDKIKMQFESVKAKRSKSFSDFLNYVTVEIDPIYKSLVNNTSAQAMISPDNSEEPYAGNIIYSCIMPYKGFQPLQYLSDGEKSIASLALLFAIQRYKQIPFLMDEVDAALDKVNIKNIISFIRSQVNTMQFITISLRKKLYGNADALVGVTTERDISCPNSQVFAISLNGYRF